MISKGCLHWIYTDFRFTAKSGKPETTDSQVCVCVCVCEIRNESLEADILTFDDFGHNEGLVSGFNQTIVIVRLSWAAVRNQHYRFICNIIKYCILLSSCQYSGVRSVDQSNDCYLIHCGMTIICQWNPFIALTVLTHAASLAAFSIKFNLKTWLHVICSKTSRRRVWRQ